MNKKLDPKRIIPYDEIKRNGCTWCLDREHTKSINVRKLFDPVELKKLNKKLKRTEAKRYMFCPHAECPYAAEFEGFESYDDWLKEKEHVFSFGSIFDNGEFPKNVTFAYSDKN